MVEYVSRNEKIECSAAEIFAKKIVKGALLKHPNTNVGLHVRYVCKRDGSAEIIKELNPKEAILDKEKSILDKGSKIKCNSFFVLVKGTKRIKISKKGGHTGRHSTQNFNTKTYTYAEITKPFEHILNAIEKKQYSLK